MNRYSHAFPLLSIIIPTYNVERYVVEAVNSALEQTLSQIEVIVVDDGSTDGTKERLAEVKDSRLFVFHQENRGLSGARNTGIRKARSTYIGFLDGDDIWYPEKGATHVAVLDRHPEVGVVHSHFVYLDETSRRTAQLLTTRVSDPSLEQLIVRNCISASVVVRASLFDKAGLFDEDLRSNEDWEMWVRLKKRTGCVFLGVPRVLAGYRVRHDSLSMDFEHHIKSAQTAIQKMHTEVPDAPSRLWSRALAEVYRISARKALSAGLTRSAFDLSSQALRQDPWIWIRSLRGFGTLVLTLLESVLPGRYQGSIYRTARWLMKVYFRISYGRRTVSGS